MLQISGRPTLASRVSTRVYQSTQNPRDLEQNVGLFEGQGRFSAQHQHKLTRFFYVFSVVKFLDLKHMCHNMNCFIQLRHQTTL